MNWVPLGGEKKRSALDTKQQEVDLTEGNRKGRLTRSSGKFKRYKGRGKGCSVWLKEKERKARAAYKFLQSDEEKKMTYYKEWKGS